MTPIGNLKKRYAKLESKRQAAEDRAVDAAKVTIPHIMPPDGHTENSRLKEPYQGLGARAVNTLASKIMLALFPPNTPFFRLSFDALTTAALQGDTDQMAEAKKKVALFEQVAAEALENTSLRATGSTTFKHLLITGNGMLRLTKDFEFKFYDLRKYVVVRDGDGNVLQMIAKETVPAEGLPEEVLTKVLTTDEMKKLNEGSDVEVDLYTLMERDGNKYVVRQEINEKFVEGSEGRYDLDQPPFIVLRWIGIKGENYGRGMVGEYLADFRATDDLSRDLLKASAAAAKIVFMREPNSVMTAKAFMEANSGDILSGRADDISTVSIDKLHDFNIVLERLRDIKGELTEAFLMHKSVQRNAERVTAAEIRFMAQDLEDALGGVYSLLSQELQAPLIRRWLKLLGDAQRLPKMPKEGLKLSITTGLEALGRGHELQKIEGMLSQAGRILTPEVVAQKIDATDLMDRLAAGWGVPDTDFLLTKEEVAEQQNQQMQGRIAEQAAPGAIQETIKQGAPNG